MTFFEIFCGGIKNGFSKLFVRGFVFLKCHNSDQKNLREVCQTVIKNRQPSQAKTTVTILPEIGREEVGNVLIFGISLS